MTASSSASASLVAAVEAVEHRSEQPDVRAVHRQVQLAEQHAELRDVAFELGALAALQREQAPVHGDGQQPLTRTTATTDRLELVEQR